jgi:Protein of Unknown function (DUF2784)
VPYRCLADAVLLAHLLFVVFVVAGGLVVLRWPRVAWLHVPAALWGVVVEWSGALCPLTPLELALRRAGGEAGYGGGFVEHYVWPVLYPAALTRGAELVLGSLVVAINVIIYCAALSPAARRA